MKIKTIKVSFQASYKFQNLGGELEIEIDGTDISMNNEIDRSVDTALYLQKQSYNYLKEVYDSREREVSTNTIHAAPVVSIEQVTREYNNETSGAPSLRQVNLAKSLGFTSLDPSGIPWTAATLSPAIKAKIAMNKSAEKKPKGD